MTSQTRSKQSGTGATIQENTPPVPQHPDTKVASVIAMLARAEGATLDQMVAATGWQSHTTRAALTRLKPRGYLVTSMKVDGVRTYRASGPAAS
ncbi:MAG: hypothetical protein JWO15_269 [Sphingomonadales bacterium]|nr:hypothetical protein [Sphingomonadales bacterium]